MLATMNPGGDFGKKELSPALRNRFTEIWVPAVGAKDELLLLLRTKLHSSDAASKQSAGGASSNDHVFVGEGAEGWDAAGAMLAFVEWLGMPEAISCRAPMASADADAPATASESEGSNLGTCPPSLRDLVSWIDFQNAASPTLGAYAAFVHGACLVFIDGIGLQVASSRAVREARRQRCITQLLQLLPTAVAAGGVTSLHVGTDTVPQMAESVRPAMLEPAASESEGGGATNTSARAPPFGIAPFYITSGFAPRDHSFSLHAPTTRANAFRVLRAMQLRKPILLEGTSSPNRRMLHYFYPTGACLHLTSLRHCVCVLAGSPGVGKTSLVQALGAACGHVVVRINLSEQSDLMELLGTNLPVEGAVAGTYAWQDGAFLYALKAGHWVVLDELNLAPQSVLEGLNSCLDHRASVFIPELGASFACPSSFRVFGCQNPLQQGGGRKGLPKSFLNRFTQVGVR